LTWLASEVKAKLKEVWRSLSSSWGRGAGGGAEEGEEGRGTSISARVETPPSSGIGWDIMASNWEGSSKGSHPNPCQDKVREESQSKKGARWKTRSDIRPGDGGGKRKRSVAG